jgi:hypothetical protein
MPEVNEFRLTPTEKASGLWLRIKQHLEDRLAADRARNDSLMTEPETAALRGRIACLKLLIALDDDMPVIGEYSPTRKGVGYRGVTNAFD